MESNLLEHWPKDAAGIPEKGALLCTEADVPGAVAIFCSMLESFSVPYYAKRRGVGEYFHILYGRSLSAGVEIYVPASRLEEAKELLTAQPLLEETPEEPQ